VTEDAENCSITQLEAMSVA